MKNLKVSIIVKNIKILAITLLIGTSSLFATTMQFPPHNNTKHPVSKSDFETKKDKKESKKEVKKKVLSEKIIYTSINNNKLYNLNYNNKELLFKEMQLEAIKNSAAFRPAIIGKE